ncbi:Xaa-Pro aminopeptidase [Helicobacter monodelphidis]|uniref:aminopeptidase P family protein n=1 Tax=Helicobacter sp. 15-1451 TaxID=2004995 RepID=UPI000DCE0861|nr:aminopeptidase P family protein [Helicobacter sp. 15-1451]RAX56806.1 Xaa-Pro aminopeptidase [Helicobacter sp. 15-1451]
MTNTRLEALRERIHHHKVDACLILTADPHASEYLAGFWKCREYVSGFSGSAGSLLVLKDKAYLWVDGRYHIQAQKECKGSGIILQKQDNNNTFMSFIKNELSEKSTLALDFRTLSLSLKHELDEIMNAKDMRLTNLDLVGEIWEERAPLPRSEIVAHKEEFCASSTAEKLAYIRKEMHALGASAHLISSLDDIAYITNLRGADVEYNPVFLAHLVITDSEALLFTNVAQVRKNLTLQGITLKAYDEIEPYLREMKTSVLLLDSSKVVCSLTECLNRNIVLVDSPNPSTLMKACKTKREVVHIKNAMIADGVALCKFFAWLEEALSAKMAINEVDIDIKLTKFRAKNQLYTQNSFATIAGFNANGALPHYRAKKRDCAKISGDGLLLIDSGAQYQNGTTDITRVVPIGRVSSAQKRDYTLVLKAHIAMTQAVFPKDIAMPMLDSITRNALWREHIDYKHGTGHGVGYYLNVHEGPQVLSYYALPSPKNRVKKGMITSIEPGIYREGKWGVRLENLVLACDVAKPKECEFGEFLCFEVLSLCPFEPSCIEKSLLSDDEIKWINSYHKKVFKALSPHLKGKAHRWLKARTKAI